MLNHLCVLTSATSSGRSVTYDDDLLLLLPVVNHRRQRCSKVLPAQDEERPVAATAALSASNRRYLYV